MLPDSQSYFLDKTEHDFGTAHWAYHFKGVAKSSRSYGILFCWIFATSIEAP